MDSAGIEQVHLQLPNSHMTECQHHMATLYCLQIPASTISFANTFGVLFTVVFYDLVLSKIATK